jgi:type I restriction enzyme R subunit
VLQHYATYKAYHYLVKHAEDDPQVEEQPAAKTFARLLAFHPYNLAQKTEVMIEHYRTFAATRSARRPRRWS